MERKYLGMSLNELNETPLEEAQRKWGEVTERVRSSSAAWQAMLATAARNHKYSFRDQLMIHEYRPHATACAEHDFWEQRFHRRVHKGLKGIRLLSEDGRDVRNVFDVGDTWPFYGHEHDLPPYIWRVTTANTAAVSQRFREAFEVDGTLPEQVRTISKQLAEMARPMYNISTEHSEDLLLISITFYIATRLGLDAGDMDLSAVRLHRERGAANVHRDDKGTANARAVEGPGRSEDVDHQLLQQRGPGTRVPGDGSEGEGDARRGPGDLSRGGPDGAGEGGPAGGHPDAGEGERAALHEGAGHLGAVQGADAPHPGEGFRQVRPDAPEVSGGVEGPEGAGAGREDSAPLPGGSGPGEGDEAGDHGPVAGTEPVGRDDGVGTEGRDGGLGSGAVRPRHGDLAGGEQGQLTLDFGLGEPERSTAPQALEPEPELEAPKVPEEKPKVPEQQRVNYRITDDALGTGGAKTKYARNVEAIRTLRRIEGEGRLATSEEQEVLAQYVGWGGLPQVFDERNGDWAKEYAALKELLSEPEYNAARASTLNAHYTSPTVVKAIYGTLERMGLASGNILEPACGTGNFFGLVPESMAGAKLYGVELDGITGRIARQLYQEADITVDGYERTHFPDNFFDAAVGNVPFGAYRVADPKYDRHGFAIHDYFFAKTLDQVRPGGVVAFVTSKGTLDKANPSVRQYIARRAELLGAVRLPNTAFKANAGTEVTTDILFLQKRDHIIDDVQPEWLHTFNNAEVKALCIGDPRIKEKMELDVDVAKLKLMEANFKSQQFALEDKLRKGFPCVIAQAEQRIQSLEKDAAAAEKTQKQDFSITILGKTYGLDAEGKPRKQEAGEALLAAAQALGKNQGTIGEYRGFKMGFHFDAVFGKVYLNLTGVATHNVELGESAVGNLTRIENAIEGIPARLQEAQERLENLHEQVRAAKEELGREFPHARELQEKNARLSELNAALSMQDDRGEHNVSEQVNFGKLNDKERVAFLVKEAERQPEHALEILNVAFRQGVYVTSQLQASNCGFYNIFKLRDVMSAAGLNDRERFDSLLCRLRDEEQVQLHAGDVTVHTPEENEKGFIDENGFRMGTFTLSRAPETFRATEKSLVWVLSRNTCGQEPKHEITEGDIVALELSENPKVHLKPYTKGGFFDGEIAHVDMERGYCVQKAGNSLTVHRLEALETVPEVGEKVRITYPKDEGRKAGVAVREQRQRCHRIA